MDVGRGELVRIGARLRGREARLVGGRLGDCLGDGLRRRVDHVVVRLVGGGSWVDWFGSFNGVESLAALGSGLVGRLILGMAGFGEAGRGGETRIGEKLFEADLRIAVDERHSGNPFSTKEVKVNSGGV